MNKNMNQTDLQKAVSIIKDCEELKTKIDILVNMGNKLSEQPLADVFELKMEKPFEKKEITIEMQDDDGEMTNLKGLLGWSIGFSSSSSSKDAKDYFTENLSVQEYLIIVNSLLIINREKLKLKINQLKELGINITA